jgi:hypothetical protein
MESPSLGAGIARSQPAAVATISFSTLGTDLIGRPLLGSVRGAPSELGIPSPGETILIGGLGQGPPSITIGRSRIGRDASPPVASDVALELTPMTGDRIAAAAGPGGVRMVQLVDQLRQWAVRIRTATSEWAGSVLRRRSRSDTPWTDVRPETTGSPLARSWSAPDRTDAEGVETTDESDSWADHLSPVIAALSAALGARVCRRFARWRKSRDRRRAPTARRLDQRSTATEPVPAGRVASRIDQTDLAATRRRVSRAS